MWGHQGDDGGEAKKLDVQIGDAVEIGGRRYDVVSDKHGGAVLEAAITKSADELFAEHGLQPLTASSFEEEFGDLPLREGPASQRPFGFYSAPLAIGIGSFSV
jgi:hypothetical protein